MRVVLAWLCLICGIVNVSAQEQGERPNVLFLAVDDLNDWIGVLGGHTQAKTPHLDRLANSGVLFDAAYCAAPLCHPSRTAIMTGLRSSTTADPTEDEL